MADYGSIDQFEWEGCKYSLIGRYAVKDFLHKYIDREFRRNSAFLEIDPGDERPQAPVFYDTVKEDFWLLADYASEKRVIAVYEQMPQIKMPERVCWNCKYFYKHYCQSDSSMGLTALQEGHCGGRRFIFNRKRDDKPKDDKCFAWNARCQGILARIEEITGAEHREGKDNG